MGPNTIHCGDCLELMADIEDKSVDMVLCDLPYQTTACTWDVLIPFNEYITINGKAVEANVYLDYKRFKTLPEFQAAKDEFEAAKKPGLWQHYKRIIKDSGAVVLTGSQPFTSKLVMSNLDWFKCEWVWEKSKPSNFLNCKKQPMRKSEDVLIFSSGQCTYNPQGITLSKKHNKNSLHENVYGKVRDFLQQETFTNYPHNILRFPNVVGLNALHPTQKPVSLFSYLIRTYTNPGDLVLDNCIGSGTTAISCIDTGRNYIGIEQDLGYFQIAQDRIAERLKQPFLFDMEVGAEVKHKQMELEV